MRNLFLLMLLMISSTTMFAQAQMDLPVTFEDAGVEYGLIGFGGAEASSIVVDPTDPSNTVAEAIKSATAELWGGTTITNAAEAGFASPVPFTVDDTRMSVRVWSPDAGIQVRLKVEDYLDPTKSVETEATTTIAAGWETLIFDFANEAPGTAALNLSYDMNKVSIFFNFGVTGAEAGEKTYYFDDIEFIGGGGIIVDDTYTITFAVDMNEVGAPFTTPEVNGSWDGWCGGCTPLEDPDGDGIWTGSKTLAPGFYEYKFAYDAWTGQESLTEGDPCTITTGGFTNRFVDLTGDVVLDPVCWASCDACDGGGDTYMVTFSVNMNDVAEPFTTPEVNGSWDGFCGGCTPLEDPDGDGIWTGTKMLAAGFYEYKFAYDSWTGQESLTEGDPCTITTDGFTNRFVDVMADVVQDPVCWATCDICPGEVLAQMDLPVTFDDAGVAYGVIGFEGAEASFIVEDPTDATNTVVQATKSATAAFFAGTTITNGAGEGFASPVPFTTDDTRMSVRVWSPDAGIQVRLKVEDYLDPTRSVETEATSTVAGDWETLIFDFANEAPGTAALNLSYDMNKASIFFNFGVDGATAGEKTYYFDDIEFIGGGGIGGVETYEVTFSVNMNEVTDPFTTPEVNGSWDGFCGGCTPLEDPDGDGIWTTTKTLEAGFYEYKFAYDSWTGQETLTPGDPCTITTDVFTNRFVDVTADVTLDVVCWEACEDCADPVVCELPDDATIEYPSGDGTDAIISWTAVPGGTQYGLRYREIGTTEWIKKATTGTAVFLNELTPGANYQYQMVARCGEERAGPSPLMNFTTPARLGDFGLENLIAFPNPSNGNVVISGFSFDQENTIIRVFDLAGRMVYEATSLNEGNNITLDLTYLQAGLYQVSVIKGISIQTLNISIN